VPLLADSNMQLHITPAFITTVLFQLVCATRCTSLQQQQTKDSALHVEQISNEHSDECSSKSDILEPMTSASIAYPANGRKNESLIRQAFIMTMCNYGCMYFLLDPFMKAIQNSNKGDFSKVGPASILPAMFKCLRLVFHKSLHKSMAVILVIR
jgi:hypothetical protein